MNWKIVSIILFILIVVETLGVGWLISIGTEMIEKGTECSINICADYDAFLYDEYSEVCYCYLNNEVAYQEYLR